MNTKHSKSPSLQ